METTEESFYLTLLSQYDKDLFPLNCAHSFKNRLSREISLNASLFEVGTSEFSFTQLINDHDDNAKVGLFDFLFVNKKEKETDPDRYGCLYKNIKLDQSNLVTPVELCGALNRLIWTTIDRFKRIKREFFAYDHLSGRIWCNFKPDDYLCIILKYETLLLLGCEEKGGPLDMLIVGKSKEIGDPAGTFVYTGPDGKTERYTFLDKYKPLVLESKCETSDFFLYPPHLFPAHTELVIYCSIVTETNVAGSKANVLKFVPISAKNQGQSLCLTWPTPIYRPLADNHLSVIEIDIRSAIDGNPVELAGSTRLLLHIKRKRDQLALV